MFNITVSLIAIMIFSVPSVFCAKTEDFLSKLQSESETINKLVSNGSIMRMETSMFGAPSGAMLVVYRLGNKMRSDAESWGVKSTTIYDGESVWIVSRSGVRELTDEKMRSEIINGIDQNNPYKFNPKWKIDGSTLFEGKDCFIVSGEIIREVQGKKTAVKILSVVDKKLLMSYKSESEFIAAGKKLKMNMLFSQYMVIEKGKKSIYPMQTEVFVNGRQMQTLVIKEMRVNQRFEDAIFDPQEVLDNEYSGPNPESSDSNSIFNKIMQGGASGK